jgi:hypothetical protein
MLLISKESQQAVQNLNSGPHGTYHAGALTTLPNLIQEFHKAILFKAFIFLSLSSTWSVLNLNDSSRNLIFLLFFVPDSIYKGSISNS